MQGNYAAIVCVGGRGGPPLRRSAVSCKDSVRLVSWKSWKSWSRKLCHVSVDAASQQKFSTQCRSKRIHWKHAGFRMHHSHREMEDLCRWCGPFSDLWCSKRWVTTSFLHFLSMGKHVLTCFDEFDHVYVYFWPLLLFILDLLSAVSGRTVQRHTQSRSWSRHQVTSVDAGRKRAHMTHTFSLDIYMCFFTSPRGQTCLRSSPSWARRQCKAWVPTRSNSPSKLPKSSQPQSRLSFVGCEVTLIGEALGQATTGTKQPVFMMCLL